MKISGKISLLGLSVIAAATTVILLHGNNVAPIQKVSSTIIKSTLNPITTVKGQEPYGPNFNSSGVMQASTAIQQTAPVPITSNPVTPKTKTIPIPKTPTKPNPKPVTTSKATAPTNSCGGGYTSQFLCLLNQYRASKGLKALSGNAALSGVALKHSEWMSSTGIFSHTGIDGSRLTERCAKAGIVCHAENLALNATSPQNLLQMWIDSPSHNANLIGPYSTVGLGISGDYATLLLN